jgi:hypothetical protein
MKELDELRHDVVK